MIGIKIPKLHKQFKVYLWLHQHSLTVCWLGDADLDKEPRLRVCLCVRISFVRLLKAMVWIWGVVLLGVFSLGLSAPVNSCDNLVEPIPIHHEDVSAHELNTALQIFSSLQFQCTCNKKLQENSQM